MNPLTVARYAYMVPGVKQGASFAFNPIYQKEVTDKMANQIMGYNVDWGAILPGGAPFISQAPTIGGGGWTSAWVANGVQFYRGPQGYLGAFNSKTGRWKQWKPAHPVVFGKKLDPAKLARVAKRHHKAYLELKRLFDKGRSRSRGK